MTKNKKRIVYVTSYAPYGPREFWAIEEVLALNIAGLDVFIIPRSWPGLLFHSKAKKILSKTINSPYFNFAILISFIKFFLSSPILTFKLAFWLVDQSDSFYSFLTGIYVLPKAIYLSHKLKKIGITHIHAFSTVSSVIFLAYVLANTNNIKWSYTIHASNILGEKYRRSSFSHMRSASFVRLNSLQGKKEYIKKFGENFLYKAHVSYLGVNYPNYLRSRVQKENFDHFNFVSVGALMPYKGYIYTIRAVRILGDKGVKNFTLRIYGDGPEEKFLKSQVQKNNLSKFIIFMGKIDNQDLLNLYRSNLVDIYIQSSDDEDGVPEAVPIGIMEAMSFSIPVIATNNGGIPEIFSRNSSCLIRQRDSTVLANRIQMLIGNKILRRKIGEQGRAIISKKFNIDRNSHNLKELFKSN